MGWEEKLERLEKIRSLVEEISEYIEYMNDEVGDSLNILTEIFGYTDGFSEEFVEALYKEIENQHKMLKEDFIIVTEEKEVTKKIKQTRVFSIYDEEYYDYIKDENDEN